MRMSLVFFSWIYCVIRTVKFHQCQGSIPGMQLLAGSGAFLALRCHRLLRISEQCALDCFRRGLYIIPNVP